MRTYLKAVLILALMGFIFSYLYDNRAVISETLSSYFNRYCDAWTACDDAGNRVDSREVIIDVQR